MLKWEKRVICEDLFSSSACIHTDDWSINVHIRTEEQVQLNSSQSHSCVKAKCQYYMIKCNLIDWSFTVLLGVLLTCYRARRA